MSLDHTHARSSPDTFAWSSLFMYWSAFPTKTAMVSILITWFLSFSTTTASLSLTCSLSHYSLSLLTTLTPCFGVGEIITLVVVDMNITIMDIAMGVTKAVDFMDTVVMVVMDVNVSKRVCKIHSTLSFYICCACSWFHIERFRGGKRRLYFKRHARRRMDYRHRYTRHRPRSLWFPVCPVSPHPWSLFSLSHHTTRLPSSADVAQERVRQYQ